MDFNTFPTYISTHALTEGDDSVYFLYRLAYISTHALTEGDVNILRQTPNL